MYQNERAAGVILFVAEADFCPANLPMPLGRRHPRLRDVTERGPNDARDGAIIRMASELLDAVQINAVGDEARRLWARMGRMLEGA